MFDSFSGYMKQGIEGADKFLKDPATKAQIKKAEDTVEKKKLEKEKNHPKNTLKEFETDMNLPVYGEAYSKHMMDNHIEGLYKSLTRGSYSNSLQQFCVGIDRYNKPAIVFITRPTLNLTDWTIGMDRTLARLHSKTANEQGCAMMTRLLLDPDQSGAGKGEASGSTRELVKGMAEKAETCGLINNNSPFITPMMNGLTSMSGFPDEVMQTTTTQGGFFHEDQTFAKGTDSLRKSVDLTLNFRDEPTCPISLIKETWVRWMALAMEGRVVAHKRDIDEQRMPYTCGIYRFVLDDSRSHIVKCAKGTGCFPKVGVDGSAFNLEAGGNEDVNRTKFTIPFTCNHIMVNDYLIFLQFNTLMKNFAPDIEKQLEKHTLPDDPSSNYMGLPYIINGPVGPKLVFVDYKHDVNAQTNYKAKVKGMLEPLSPKNRADYVMQVHPNGGVGAPGPTVETSSLKKKSTIPKLPDVTDNELATAVHDLGSDNTMNDEINKTRKDTQKNRWS